MPTPTWNALTDPLPRWDPKSQELAYNNFTDRIRVELPEIGDPASSGVVSINYGTLPPSGLPVSVDRWNGDSLMIWSASGTTSIPVYLDSPIPVSVSVDIETDSIKVFSSSGTPTLPVYLTNQVPVKVEVDQVNDSIRIFSSSGTSPLPVYLTNQVPMKVEVDQSNDSIRIFSSSGTSPLPVYLSNHVPMKVEVDQSDDSIRVFSSSGTSVLGTYLVSRLDKNVDSVTVGGSVGIDDMNPVNKTLIKKRISYNVNNDISSIKSATAATASGTGPCLIQTFTYNNNRDVDYIIESTGVW